MRNGKIVVVDDNNAVLKTLRIILSREFKTVICISNPSLLPALLREDDIDVVLLDMNFGIGKQTGSDGLFWLNHITGRKNPPAVVLITAFGDIELAVTALKNGATDFIVKPWENEKFISTIVAAYEHKTSQRERESIGETVKKSQQEDNNTQESLINQLINFLLYKYTTLYGRNFPVVSKDGHERLTSIMWTGNLQLLEQTIERAFLLNDDHLFTAAHFIVEEDDTKQQGKILTLEEMEKQFIEAVLIEKKNNLTLTAQQLNISRQTLYNKMRKYNI